MQKYDSENIFAKMLRDEFPAVKVSENAHYLAIMDVFPQSKGHLLVIPKSQSRNLLDADPQSLATVIPHVQKLAIAAKAALGADGIRIAQFNEAPAGQSVFHLHWHIIPIYEGEKLGAHGKDMADMDELNAIAEQIRAQLS